MIQNQCRCSIPCIEFRCILGTDITCKCKKQILLDGLAGRQVVKHIIQIIECLIPLIRLQFLRKFRLIILYICRRHLALNEIILFGLCIQHQVEDCRLANSGINCHLCIGNIQKWDCVKLL
nr:MAG TPA: hypothetical protein [Caudoviricetes sp.]